MQGTENTSDTIQATSRPRRRSRPRRAYGPRLAVQLVTLGICVAMGVQFGTWVGRLEAGSIAGVRPPGVEGFLPISGLISLRQLIATGEFSMIHPAALVILALACLSALLLKKSFCSWLCPVGTVSEYAARLAHRVTGWRVKLPRWLDYPLMGIKYLLLIFFLHAIFFRMATADVTAFLLSPYNKVADIKMFYFFAHISALAIKVILALVALSLVVPYFWCRYLCPYGALLGALSWFSPLKIRRSPLDCTSCGRCAAVCPAFLPVDLKLVINSPECTGCMECAAHCPVPTALAFGPPPRWHRKVKPAAVAVLVIVLFYGGIGVAKLAGRWHSRVDPVELQQRVQHGLNGPDYGHFGR